MGKHTVQTELKSWRQKGTDSRDICVKALLTGLQKHIMVKMNVKMQLLQKSIVFLDTKLSKIL